MIHSNPVPGGAPAHPSPVPSFSVVICTDGRADAVATTLRSLLYLDGPPFEVVVVRGPTEDGIDEVLAAWAGRIKVAKNPERNLSISRNIGIRLSAGDIVAFIDDDAIPEPEWLTELAQAYGDASIGGAGGFVLNPDGVTFQYTFGTADRLGGADLSWTHAAPELGFPFTASYPHLLGANCSFRRHALIGIGGFDEEFEYYLEETDLAARLVDAGWGIAQIEGAYVHHKCMPSALRKEVRVLTHWYPVLKNRIYFGLVNGLSHYSIDTVVRQAGNFVNGLAGDVDRAIALGKLTEADRARFWRDVDRAWRDGLVRGLAGKRRLPPPASWDGEPPGFLAFPRLAPPGRRRCFCFLSQDFPPGPVGGIGRYVDELAHTIAALGHHVHVLTRGESHDRVDFEAGVWVHRVIPTPEDAARALSLRVPESIGAHAERMRREVDGVAARRAVDAVYAPIWDCEGLAVVAEGRFPVIVGLQTTLRFWLQSHGHLAQDPAFMSGFVVPMLEAETRLLREAAGLHAISAAIADEIRGAYGVPLDRDRTGVVPLGLDDWTRLPSVAPFPLAPGQLRLLFVGRLEARKGIDVLLTAAKRVLGRHPHVCLDVVGNDRIEGPDGRTYRADFDSDSEVDAIRDRVRFHGQVAEEQLRGFYAACDALVTPSRFESFGLMLLEGMMFGKPVIGCRAGGMVEVVEDGVSGLLAEPGDVDSLEACIERLVTDADLRRRLGAGARARFESRFTATAMASAVVGFVSHVSDEWRAERRLPAAA